MKNMVLRRFFSGALLFVLTAGGLPGIVKAGGYFGSMVARPTQKGSVPTSSKKGYALYFFLGQRHLEAGNRKAAIEAWTRYVDLAPQDARSLAVREKLTLLKLAEAREFARMRVRHGHPRHPGEMPDKSVAVFHFRNQGRPELGILSKGLAAMIITDLSKVPGLQVLEREKMAALMREIRLGQTGVVDRESAPRMGKVLAAHYVVWGKMGQPEKNRLRLDSKVGESESLAESKSTGAEGPLEEFFRLEKELVEGILAGLGVREEDLTPEILSAVRKIHTKSLAALAYYSAGLEYLDQERFPQAKAAFRRATEADPSFELAREAYLSTPRGRGEKGGPVEKAVHLTGAPKGNLPDAHFVEEGWGPMGTEGEGDGSRQEPDGLNQPTTLGRLDQRVNLLLRRPLILSPPVTQGTSGPDQGKTQPPANLSLFHLP